MKNKKNADVSFKGAIHELDEPIFNMVERKNDRSCNYLHNTKESPNNNLYS